MSETVNHPRHYSTLAASCDKCGDSIECIEVVRHMNFNLGNVVKYIWRAGHKGNVLEDLKKALWYLQDEVSRLEEIERVADSFYVEKEESLEEARKRIFKMSVPKSIFEKFYPEEYRNES